MELFFPKTSIDQLCFNGDNLVARLVGVENRKPLKIIYLLCYLIIIGKFKMLFK